MATNMISSSERACPLFPYSEICKFLNAQISLSVEDLKASKPEVMLAVYEVFAGTLDDGFKSPQQLDFHGLQYMEDPDVHRNSGQLLRLFFFLRGIFRSCGFQDFKIEDIIHPNPKRTRRLLSVLYNYILYWAPKCKRFEEVQSRAKETIFANQELERRNSEVAIMTNKKLETVTALRQRCASEAVQQKFEELAELTSEKETLAEKCGAVKTDIAQIKTSISKQLLENRSMEEKKEEIQQQIVWSPDRVQAEVLQLKQKIEAKIAAQKPCWDSYHPTSANMANLQNLQKALDEIIECNQLCIKEGFNLQQNKQKSLEHENEARLLNKQLAEKPSEKQYVHDRLVTIQKMHSKEIAHVNRKKEDLKKQCQEIKGQRKKQEQLHKTQIRNGHNYEKLYEKKKTLSNEIQKIQTTKEKIEVEGKAKIDRIYQELDETLDEVDREAKEILKAIVDD